jgi:hypothetical protein
MGRRRKYVAPEISTKFSRQTSVIVDGFEINRGDIIKIKDEHGGKFKFDHFVTNTETGATWVDCFEIINKVPSVFRSFKVERVKRIPTRGKRSKRVNGSTTD